MTDIDIDQALVIAMQKGNHTALAALYDRHASQMLGMAERMLHNPHDAEDLLHDVFLEVWQKVGNYSADRGPVRTWLMILLRSRAIDRLRRLAVAHKHAMMPSDSLLGPDTRRRPTRVITPT